VQATNPLNQSLVFRDKQWFGNIQGTVKEHSGNQGTIEATNQKTSDLNHAWERPSNAHVVHKISSDRASHLKTFLYTDTK
jgi:hypothetical protein